MFTKRRGTSEFRDKAAAAQEFFSGRKKRRRTSLRRTFMIGFAAGAAGMFILDPRTGRRRRALVRDKVVRIGHAVDDAVTDTVPRKLQYVSGFAQGLSHRLPLGSNGGAHEADDDNTITDRVMSTIFRDLNIHPGPFNVNTVDRVVYLRGTYADQDKVAKIERHARRVPGVRDVVNLINHPEIDPSAIHPGLQDQAR